MGAKWTVNPTTTEEQVSGAAKKLGVGDFSGAFALVRAISFGNTPGLRANYAKDKSLANGMLGLKLDTVQDTVKCVVTKYVIATVKYGMILSVHSNCTV